MRDGAKKHFARQLRANMSDAEQCLWRRIRQRQLANCRFRRQHPIGPFITDFACVEKRLVVEIDGGQHNSESDSGRDDWFHRYGYQVLHFWNNDVLSRTEDVLSEIMKVLASIAHPHPSLPPQAGEGAKAVDAVLEPFPRVRGKGRDGGA
jgi:very-short-patch-repair endonuclease